MVRDLVKGQAYISYYGLVLFYDIYVCIPLHY